MSIPNKQSEPVTIQHTPAGYKLKIDKTITLARKTETLNSVCSYTGIVINIDIPSIPGCVLEYTSPLSNYKNVEGIIKQGLSYLNRLEMQVLAGLWLTAYKHYDLVAAGHNSNSSIQNAMLRTCKKEILIESLILSNSINTRYAKRSPQFCLDYAAHEDSKNITGALQSFTKNLHNIIFPPANASNKTYKEEESENVTVYGTPVYLQTKSRNRNHKVISVQEQQEERIKLARKEAKIHLAEIEEAMLLPIGFIKLLKDASSKDNIVAIDTTLRNKIVAKLRERDTPATIALAKCFEDAAPRFAADLFAEFDTETPINEKEIVSTTRKESLKDKLARLAAEKAAKETV